MPLQRGQVEDVLQALAVGLEHDRERAVSAGDGQQLRRALAHLPQRRSLAGTSPGQQQCSRRVLTEVAGEQRRAAERADDQLLDLFGVDQQRRLGRIDGGRQQSHPSREVIDRGQSDHYAVVRPHRLDVEADALAKSGLDRQRPRRMHPGPEGRKQHDAPVAKLVLESLQHDGLVGGQSARDFAFLGDVLQQVLGGK